MRSCEVGYILARWQANKAAGLVVAAVAPSTMHFCRMPRMLDRDRQARQTNDK